MRFGERPVESSVDLPPKVVLLNELLHASLPLRGDSLTKFRVVEERENRLTR